jgi:HK97 family phage prohead protease
MIATFPIEGWASIYDAPDLNNDVVAPGAFARSLARTRASGVKLLCQHVAERPIGRWLSFEEREKGLYAKGELYLATRCAEETAALIDAGIIDGLSIGFRVLRAIRGESGRRIVEADLWEVSVVTFPMAPAARIVRAGRQSHRSVFADAVRGAAAILSA